MGSLGQTFSRDTMPEGMSFSPLPVGDYVCSVKKTEVKATKAGDGQYIKLDLEVAQGDYAGRKLFAQIIFQHPSQQSVEIGLANLNKLCECAGIPNISDSNELLGTVCAVNLTIRKDQNGGDRNEVKYYMLPTEAKPSPTKSGQRSQAQQPSIMTPPPMQTPQPQQPATGFAAPAQPQAPVAPQQYQQPAQPQAAPPAMQYQTQPPVQPTQPATAPMVSNVIDDEIPFGN